MRQLGPSLDHLLMEITIILLRSLAITMKKRPELDIYCLRTNGVNNEEIEARADSILYVIKRKRNFEAMVTEFSDDVASVKDGGVYDWFPEGRMVPEFNDFSFNGRIGEIES